MMLQISKYRRMISASMALVLLLLTGIFFTNIAEIRFGQQQFVQYDKEYSRKSMEDKKLTGVPEVCDIPPLVNLNDFFNYGKTNGRTSCTHIAEMGGNFRKYLSIFPYNEAARIVCLDRVTRGNCTVLSFGVGLDNSFDAQMATDVGCEVHMFDPTLNIIGDLIDKVHFYPLGLYNQKQTLEIGNLLVQVDNYEGILQMINLTNSQIDYLKIDVDVAEVKFFEDVITNSPHLLDNVQQLAFEIHPILFKTANMTLFEAFQPFWKAMHQLDCLGFDLISFVPNLHIVCEFQFMGKAASGCYDIVYLRRPTNQQETSNNFLKSGEKIT